MLQSKIYLLVKIEMLNSWHEGLPLNVSAYPLKPLENQMIEQPGLKIGGLYM